MISMLVLLEVVAPTAIDQCIEITHILNNQKWSCLSDLLLVKAILRTQLTIQILDVFVNKLILLTVVKSRHGRQVMRRLRCLRHV